MPVHFNIIPDSNLQEEKGETTLHQFVRMGLVERAIELISTNINLETKDAQGLTALDIAIEQKNLDMVTLLLANDARIHDMDKLDNFLQSQNKENPDVIFCKDKMQITISYTWIGGNPAESRTSAAKGSRIAGVLGQDTKAAISMAKCINPKYHRILFWCLDKEVDYYHAILSPHNIKVCSIEQYLDKCSKKASLKDATEKVRHVMQVLSTPERNTRRSKTSIKNIIAFYLLLVHVTDFVMDSNVGPTQDAKLNLYKYNSFYMPCVYKEFGEEGIDVWTLYAPPKDPLIKAAFDNFYIGWKHLEQLYEISGDTEAYRKAHGRLVVNSVQTAAALTQDGNINCWYAEYLFKNRSAVAISEIGLRKYFDNTHKHSHRAEYESEDSILRQHFNEILQSAEQTVSGSVDGFFHTKIRNTIYDYVVDEDTKSMLRKSPDFPVPGSQYTPMFTAASSGDTERLMELIALGDNVDQVMTAEEAEGQTPLHVAIENKQLAAVEVLLKNGARVDIALKDGTREMVAYDYINYIIPADERQPFLDLYHSYHPSIARPSPK